MAMPQHPAYSEETTPDGGRKRTIGPIVAWAVVMIVGMFLTTLLLLTNKISAADLSSFRMPWPW